MNRGLRRQAVTGLGWSAAAQAGKQAVQFAVTIALARLLLPGDFGLIAMIMVFVGFAGLFVEAGLGGALVQAERLDERHASSMFWLNLAAGLALTIATISLAPALAAFYGEPALAPLTRLVGVVFVLNALAMVQAALLQRALDFRGVALAELAGAGAAGALAVTLALRGHGVWSLAWYLVATAAATAAALWAVAGWRPRLRFSPAAARELLGYGGGQLGYNVASYWVRNADDLLVGRVLGSAALGIYARAHAFLLFPLAQLHGVFGRVMFPTLSRLQSDVGRFRALYLRVLGVIALIAFPLMAGLFVTAEHVVLALLGPAWAGAVPVLRILALLGLTQALTGTTGWIYQALGRTGLLLGWGVGAGVVTVLAVVAGLAIGTVEAIAAAYALATGVVLFYPAFALPGRLIGLRVREVLRVVLGPLGCAFGMALAVAAADRLLPEAWPHALALAALAALGAVVYGGLAHAFQLEALGEAKRVAGELLGARAGVQAVRRSEPARAVS